MVKCEHYEDEEDQKVYYEMYKLAMIVWNENVFYPLLKEV